jgi:Tol biopolymer transport system component
VTPLVLKGPGSHFVYGPAWSPDGRTIAFLRRTETSETWLCLVASSGGPERRLIRLHDRTAVFYADNSHLAWSLDSRRILAPFQVGERKQAIHWITVASAAVQRVTEPTASDYGPVTSPDRQSLVILRPDSSPGGGQELLLQKLKPDGSADGSPRLLMRGPGFISGVAWAPGGNDLIVCKREMGTSSSLYRMPTRPGGRLTLIGAEECTGVEVSRADEKGRANLVYGSNREPNAQLWKADLTDLEHGSPFAPSSRSDTLPAFSPDGASVVFRSTRSGAPAAWIANQDGTQPHRLSDLGPSLGGIEWSPNGGQILFSSVGQGLAIVPLTGGTPSVIAAGGVPVWPHWSHGSGLIY